MIEATEPGEGASRIDVDVELRERLSLSFSVMEDKTV
jgi:hypothetical protein